VARFDLRGYARRGAEARVAELNAELVEIYRVFLTCAVGVCAVPISLRIRKRRRSPSAGAEEECRQHKRKRCQLG
jgi:hypothetical protein